MKKKKIKIYTAASGKNKIKHFQTLKK